MVGGRGVDTVVSIISAGIRGRNARGRAAVPLVVRARGNVVLGIAITVASPYLVMAAGRLRRRRAWRRIGTAAIALHDAARRRLALGLGERAFQAHVVVHAPAEVLVEGRGAAENPAHVRYALDCPITEVLVEGRGAVEHQLHGRDAVDPPVAKRLIE